jgi:hypothetical protein
MAPAPLADLIKLLTAPIPPDQDTSTTCQKLQAALTKYLTKKNFERTHLDLLSTFVPIRTHTKNIYDGLGLTPNVSDDTLARRVNQIRRLYNRQEYKSVLNEADKLGKRTAPDEDAEDGEGAWVVSEPKRAKYDNDLGTELMHKTVKNQVARQVAQGLMGELMELSFKGVSFTDQFDTVTEVETEVRRLKGSAGTAELLAVWVGHRRYLKLQEAQGMDEYKEQFLEAGGTSQQYKYWRLKHQHLATLHKEIGIYPMFLRLDGLWAKVGEGPLKEVVNWWKSPKRPKVPMEKFEHELNEIWDGFRDHLYPEEAIKRLEEKVRPTINQIMGGLSAEGVSGDEDAQDEGDVQEN